MLKALARLHRDERGAEGLEKLLIIAAVALPLLGVLIYYRQDIGNWVSNQWDAVRTPANNPVPAAPPTP